LSAKDCLAIEQYKFYLHWIDTLQRAANCLVAQTLELWIQAEDVGQVLLFNVTIVHIENVDHLAVFSNLDDSSSVPVPILELGGNTAANFNVLLQKRSKFTFTN
jgi:hypothetical protein